MVSQNVTCQLRSDAKDYLAGLLGKDRGEATNSSHVDHKNKDDEDDDDVAWSEEHDESDDDVCSVSVLHKPGEASSSDIEDYGPYWNNSSESMPYLDHLSDQIWNICVFPGSFCLLFFSFLQPLAWLYPLFLNRLWYQNV